ncbi:hypothetical protein [Hymenobacter metallicola]|uniref:Uncharacterized protein n=1 Tax=Hymenobacter metallicola TaxID=2563114 RepID=A0A4Z0QH33_9BACT|nr:hypothetical protein [Hymenobacter metallicola]TGE29367.1 hypothetical protein E5K02_07910 [Hymenobacter metallicola]
MAQRDQAHLADRITRMLSNGKIDKPSLHNAPQERCSDFYRVSLAAEDIVASVSILFDFEAEVIDIDPAATDLTDKWSNLDGLTKR